MEQQELKIIKNKDYISEKLKEIEEIINEVLDSEDQRNDNENFYAILDKLYYLQETYFNI